MTRRALPREWAAHTEFALDQLSGFEIPLSAFVVTVPGITHGVKVNGMRLPCRKVSWPQLALHSRALRLAYRPAPAGFYLHHAPPLRCLNHLVDQTKHREATLGNRSGSGVSLKTSFSGSRC